jgi:hypothetical protein
MNLRWHSRVGVFEGAHHLSTFPRQRMPAKLQQCTDHGTSSEACLAAGIAPAAVSRAKAW